MIEKVGWLIIGAIEISIFGYFFYVSIYNLTLSIFAFKKPIFNFDENGPLKNIVILIPAYKEDEVIVQTIKGILETDYPSNLFNVVVIADSFREETLDDLSSYPIELIRVSFKRSTKVRAINSGLDRIGFGADVMIVLDADNEVKNDFLKNVSALFNSDHKAVQGRRIIKNPTNQLTFLDDLSEQINNHINRKGSCALGGSSSIAGSGFAVSYDLGIEIFRSLDSVGGFDKEFELELLKRGISTAYVDQLILYDEKVANKQVFKNQRRRWISSQYVYLRKYLKAGIVALFKGDLSFFNSSVLRNVQLPRLLNLGLFTIIILLVYFFSDYIKISAIVWIITYTCFLAAILLAIPRRYYRFQLLQSLLSLPIIFVHMFLLLFKLKGANKNFIHTPHGATVKNE